MFGYNLDMKRCSKCGELKPLDAFYKAKGTRDGLRGDCRDCFRARAKARYPLVREQAIERAKRWREENIDRFRETQRRNRSTPEGRRKQREYHLRSTFGITIERYEALLEAQGGACLICRAAPSANAALHVDHDHETGEIRGLLCVNCNQSLGQLRDDPDLLVRAVSYLTGFQDALADSERLGDIARKRALALRTGPATDTLF